MALVLAHNRTAPWAGSTVQPRMFGGGSRYQQGLEPRAVYRLRVILNHLELSLEEVMATAPPQPSLTASASDMAPPAASECTAILPWPLQDALGEGLQLTFTRALHLRKSSPRFAGPASSSVALPAPATISRRNVPMLRDIERWWPAL